MTTLCLRRLVGGKRGGITKRLIPRSLSTVQAEDNYWKKQYDKAKEAGPVMLALVAVAGVISGVTREMERLRHQNEVTEEKARAQNKVMEEKIRGEYNEKMEKIRGEYHEKIARAEGMVDHRVLDFLTRGEYQKLRD